MPGTNPAPQVTVVIATHNRSDKLVEAVASIEQQTFRDFEILIIDDASSDDTRAVLERLAAREPRLRALHSERNLGPGLARNLAVSEARGDLIAVLDDDERALPERLATQVEALDRQPQVAAVVSAIRWVDDGGRCLRISSGRIVRDELPNDPHALFELLYLDGNQLPNGTLMVRREIFERYGYSDRRLGEDWQLFLQLCADGHRLASLPMPLVDSLRDPSHQSLTRDKLRAFRQQREIIDAVHSYCVERGHPRLAALRNRARARQLVREARYWYGVRSVALTVRALALVPTDRVVWSNVGWLGKIVVDKLRRGVTRP